MAESEHTTGGKSPAFQFYPKDFLSDEKVRVMTLPERGAYITLLCLCWLEGSLPADVGRLSRLCGVSAGVFRRLWPALAPCFRVHGERQDRLVQPRLERERRKQDTFSSEQSERGKRGAAARWNKDGGAIDTPAPQNSGATIPPMANNGSSSPVSDLLSADCGQKKKEPPADARSKRPIYQNTRFVVFEWQLDDLRRMLGPHVDEFDLHEWFDTLAQRAEQIGQVIPQRDGGKWLYEQTLAEAVRRGLPIAAAQSGTGKTAGNLAAAARFIARGQTT